jgi:hypothetical protein
MAGLSVWVVEANEAASIALEPHCLAWDAQTYRTEMAGER